MAYTPAMRITFKQLDRGRFRGHDYEVKLDGDVVGHISPTVSYGDPEKPQWYFVANFNEQYINTCRKLQPLAACKARAKAWIEEHAKVGAPKKP